MNFVDMRDISDIDQDVYYDTKPVSQDGSSISTAAEMSYESELYDLLRNEKITTLFQPIYDMGENTLFAYEALSRAPRNSPLHMPALMFSTAKKHERLFAMDSLCRKKAIQNFSKLDSNAKLTLNVDPYSLVEFGSRKGMTVKFLDEAGIKRDRVILELTEYSKTNSYKKLRKAIDHYRGMGFSIAIDDLSAGYSNLRLMAEIEPEYLKLDKYFLSQAGAETVSLDFMKLIVEMADRISCKIIAEGIENEEQISVIRSLGIDFGQGYLLGHPAELLPIKPPEVLFLTNESGDDEALFDLPNIIAETGYVSAIRLSKVDSCAPDTPISSVLERFRKHPELQIIPVSLNSQVEGVLSRDEVLGAFSQNYGHSLYRRALAKEMMNRDPLVVNQNDSLVKVSELAMSRSPEMVYSPIVVCDRYGYAGTASIRELLETITRIKIDHAKQCSPLTGLPGNLSIDQQLDHCIESGNPFSFCYLDLDHFKAFNDRYGFKEGDRMIRLLADILDLNKQGGDFIGHIGGDDFVCLSFENNWKSIMNDVLEEFGRRSVELYEKADRDNGFIKTHDRKGNPCQFPLVSLSIAAVCSRPGAFSSRLELSEVASEVKKKAKKIEGNSLVVDQRNYNASVA